MVRDLSVRLTYRDYAALPDDGRRYEIHDGELSVTPAPNPNHQRVIAALLVLLDRHVKAERLGEVFVSPLDVILDDSTIVQPDLVFLAPERAGLVSGRGIEGAPTLVIQVLSPSTTQIDLVRKRQLYARHGVPHYWIVDPEELAVDAYVLGSEGYTLALRATGAEPVSPPPFDGLGLVPAALRP